MCDPDDNLDEAIAGDDWMPRDFDSIEAPGEDDYLYWASLDDN